MPIGQTVVPYAAFQAAFESNPDQMNSAVMAAASQAAGGDTTEQQRLVAKIDDLAAKIAQRPAAVDLRSLCGHAAERR